MQSANELCRCAHSPSFCRGLRDRWGFGGFLVQTAIHNFLGTLRLSYLEGVWHVCQVAGVMNHFFRKVFFSELFCFVRTWGRVGSSDFLDGSVYFLPRSFLRLIF